MTIKAVCVVVAWPTAGKKPLHMFWTEAGTDWNESTPEEKAESPAKSQEDSNAFQFWARKQID